MTVDGVVDTGAVTLVLLRNVVERLGLERQGTAFVTHAEERRDERPLAEPVTVWTGNRTMVVHLHTFSHTDFEDVTSGDCTRWVSAPPA